MYSIKTVSLFYDNNFKNKIENIKKYEPNIKIITNYKNELDIEFIETKDKYEIIEYCINKYKNTLFLDIGYFLNSNFYNFETQKDLGLIKNNDEFSLDCIFCENLDCLSYLKSKNLKNINFNFNFFILSKKILKIENITSIFINCDNSILRQSEYLTCLYKNIENPEINKIYYLKKEKITDINIIKKDVYNKLNYIEHKGNILSLKCIFDYININDIKGYKIITFPDIYFKELNLNSNFNNFKNKFKNKNIYISLSAYNVNNQFDLENNSHLDNIYNCLNHKALIFEDKINLEDDTIKYNNFTSINYITEELNNNNNNYIFNIPNVIKIYHLDNLKKKRENKLQIDNKKYLLLPTMNKITFDYIKFNNKDYTYSNYNKLCKFLGNYIKIVN